MATKKMDISQEIALIDHILSEIPYYEVRLSIDISKEGYEYILSSLKNKKSALIALSKIR